MDEVEASYLLSSTQLHAQDVRMNADPYRVGAKTFNTATAGERTEADCDDGALVFVDVRKESKETRMDTDDTADSPQFDVKPMINMNKSEKYLKLCEVLLVAVVLMAIVGVLILPTVFYGIWTAAQIEEPEDIVPTCAQVTAYSGDICRDELLSLQTCFSDGVTSPPTALNIPSIIDQEIGENIIMSLANGLSILHPNQQCREAIMSLLCISIFNLCDHNDTWLTIPREYCLHIRDDVCDEVWHKAVDFQFPLPVCEDLPNATITLECIDFTNQTTASSDNQSYSNTTPNRLECSDGFYFDENGSRLCLPACGEWDPFPFVTYSILVSTIVCLVSSMVMIGLALTVQRDKLLVFPSILAVYMCGTLFFTSIMIIVGFFGSTALFCKSMDHIDNFNQGNETAFCIISGIVFYYSGMQTYVWAVLDAVFLFWAIVAPFSYQQFKLSGRIRKAHIISVLLGLLVPLPTPLIQLVYGYTNYFTQMISCIGYNIDYIYYTWVLPISVIVGTTTFMQIYIIWTIFKEFVLKKLLNTKKVSSQIGKVEVKLILLSVHYNLYGIVVVVASTLFYTGSYFDNQVEYFLCESSAGSGCQQYLSEIRTSVILFMVAIIVWLLTPVMSIVCKINVLQNYFLKTCFKRIKSLLN